MVNGNAAIANNIGLTYWGGGNGLFLAGTGTLTYSGTTAYGGPFGLWNSSTLVLAPGGSFSLSQYQGNELLFGTPGTTLVLNGGSFSSNGNNGANGGWIGNLTMNSGSCSMGGPGSNLVNLSPANQGGWASFLGYPNTSPVGSVVALNGGVFSVQALVGGDATCTIDFNGGTLQALATASSLTQQIFLPAPIVANVQAGGAVIDSNGNNIAITANLLHDPALGASPDGGLTKNGGGTLTLSGSDAYTGPTTVNAGTLEFSNAANQTLVGNVSGAGALATMGPGMLILSGSNSYSGGTTIGGGTLQMGSALALGATNGSLAVNSPGALDLNGKSVTVGSFSGGGTVNNSGGGFCTLSVGANDAGGGFSGIIQNTTGTVALTKIGAGNLDLVGTSTYSGPTTISAGTLELDGGGNNLPAATALTIASSGVLDMAGNPLTVGSLSGSAGAIVMNSLSSSYLSTLTVAPSSGSTTTFAGNIIGNNALAVSGSGELTLSGTNTYTGGTTVSGGTLDIAAPSALAGSGLVTIAAGGRLVLGSGAGIGALLAASSPVSSGEVALSAAASAPATIGGYENTSGNMATLGGAPPLSQGGGGSAVGGTAAAVPEPATIALLAAGALMLVGARWRRRG